MADRTLTTVRTMRWASPWGALPVLVRNGRVRAIALDPRAPLPVVESTPPAGRVGPIANERDLQRLMRAALCGELSARERIAASDLADCTPFERRVLMALAKVRNGSVMRYGELAAAIGSPRAARAVGGALGKNPIPLLLPCHRVVSAHGIGGYGGGAARGAGRDAARGADRDAEATWRPGRMSPISFKRALLAREGVTIS